MKLPVTFFANFSPYHDPDPISDFYDDTAQRVTSVVASVFAVHILFFFIMSPNFVMPDMIEDEPDTISVEIITIEPEPEAPVIVPPKPKPSPKPEPKPQPVPEPTPQPVQPQQAEVSPPPPPAQEIVQEQVNEPLPEIFVPPEIIEQPIIIPDPLPAQIPQPQPEPIIEYYEPPPPEPQVEIFEPEVIEPEVYTPPPPIETLPDLPNISTLPPIEQPQQLEPTITRQPEPQPEPEQAYQPEYVNPNPTILASPEEAITEDEKRRAIAEQQAARELEQEEIKRLQREARELRKQEEREARELRQQEQRNAQEQKRLEELQVKEQRRTERETRRLEREAEKQLRRETQQRERQIREDARSRRREADRQRRDDEKQARDAERQRRNDAKDREREIKAQERQARDDARRRDRDAERQRRASERVEERRQREQRNSPNSNAAPRPQRSPTIAGPIAGGGNPPPSSGTRRGSAGASGWTLAPGSEGNSPGAGYDGLILDIRCREAGKTHLECPEYLRAFKGRNAQGFERFGRQHATPAGSGPSSNSATQPFSGVGGLLSGGGAQLGQIGDNSINGGGPSSTVLEDIGGFNNEFRSNPVRGVDRHFNQFEVPKEEPKDPNNWVLDLDETEPDE